LTDLAPKVQRIARVARAFTPGAPIDTLDLFAGRFPLINDVISVLAQKGKHVALYGERGVGKTSLANVLAEMFSGPDLPELRSVGVNCATDDTFTSLWRGVFRKLGIDHDGALGPEDIRFALEEIPPAIIVIDELDRLDNDEALTLLSDTIKTLSDHSVSSTLVLVGVAQSIGDLIGEHQSIGRSLEQIEMPRMSRRELAEIIEKGCAKADITARPEAVAKMAYLSEGLPHYAHLLGLNAGQRVVQDDRTEITVSDVNAAIPSAIAKHTLKSEFLRATRSTRPDNLYPKVLLACALAGKNQLGYFSAGAIRKPLAVVTGRPLDIPAFARHLKQFLEPERGAILQRDGEPRNYFYRFSDPIMQPYVILNGLSEGLITDEQLQEVQGQDAPPEELRDVTPPKLF